MADNIENLPGFMASIKAGITSLGEKIGLIAEQSERIKSLESSITILRSEKSEESASLKRERDEAMKALTEERTAHAATRALLVAAENNVSNLIVELTETKVKLADPKFAGNKLAAETLSKIGMKPVAESSSDAKPKTLTERCREAKSVKN